MQATRSRRMPLWALAFTEMAILIFLEIVFKKVKEIKADAGLDTLHCRLRDREGCHCGCLPSHYRRARTQDYLVSQSDYSRRRVHETKIIWLAGPERDLIFHLRVRVTECREQGSHCRDERLA